MRYGGFERFYQFVMTLDSTPGWHSEPLKRAVALPVVLRVLNFCIAGILANDSREPKETERESGETDVDLAHDSHDANMAESPLLRAGSFGFALSRTPEAQMMQAHPRFCPVL